jgi:hypothetical protein
MVAAAVAFVFVVSVLSMIVISRRYGPLLGVMGGIVAAVVAWGGASLMTLFWFANS